MNNIEKANAAMLKKAGFHIFYQYSHGGTKGCWWATHHKLIGQYCVKTAADDALYHLNNGILHRHKDTDTQLQLELE